MTGFSGGYEVMRKYRTIIRSNSYPMSGYPNQKTIAVHSVMASDPHISVERSDHSHNS